MSDEYANDVVRMNAIKDGTRFDMEPIPQAEKLVLRACHSALMEIDTWITVFQKRRGVIQHDITEMTAQAINEHCGGDITQEEIAVALFDWEFDMEPIPQTEKLVLRECRYALMEIDTWITVFKKRRDVIQHDITEMTAQAINEHCGGDITQEEIAVALFDWDNDVLDIITSDKASEIINDMKEKRNGTA